MSTERPYWTAKELAAYLDLNEDTMYAELKRGGVPGAVRFGRLWRIMKDAFYASLTPTEHGTGKG